uniref:Putative monocarboxylate transporter n=2 Tax=Ixodes ricinus TaxID=34613 RepID=V5H3H4_IXORI
METSQRHGTEETDCSADKQRMRRRQSWASGVDTCWHIAAVAFLAQMLLAISDRNSGILYVGYMDMFSIERKQAIWPQTIAFMVGCPAGLAVALLHRRFSLWAIGLTASTLTWVGPVAASFAPNIAWVTGAMGFLHGLGSGMFFVTMSMALLMYFDRYRGVANGIKSMGGTSSSLFFPKLLVFLNDSYGFRGTLLLFGGIAMHLFVFALFLKEPPWIKKRPHLTKEAKTPAKKKNTGDSQHETTSDISTGIEPTQTKSPTLQLFLSGAFYVIIFSGLVVYYNQNIFFSTIIDFHLDKGFSMSDAALTMTYFAVAEIIGRLGLCFLADQGYLRRTSLLIASFFFMGVSMFAVTQVQSLLLMQVCCLLLAVFYGSALTTQMVVIADYLGVDQLSLTYGLTGLIAVPLFLGNPFILGAFRDEMGSYDNMYRILSGFYVLNALLWLWLVWSGWRRNRRTYSLCNTDEVVPVPEHTTAATKDDVTLKEVSIKENSELRL